VRDAVVDALNEAEMLLVLDNFEHVLRAADFLNSVLVSCVGLTMLVTSRTLLRISGEHAVPVPPLVVPGSLLDVSLAELTRAPAVCLFVERAAAVVPSFALTPDSAPLVADICRLLDGLPLAIELAAARVNVLPLTTIRTRLDQRLPLLTGGARCAPSSSDHA
jgi:predicted ATPase